MEIAQYNDLYLHDLQHLMQYWDDGVEINRDLLKEEINQFTQENEGVILLALDENNRPIGYASFLLIVEPLFGYRCELQQLLTHPKHRHQGVATALMRAVEERATIRECRSIWLSSRLHLDGAHEFYQSQGFSEQKRSVFFEKIISGDASSLFPDGSLSPETIELPKE